ncbi:hypothetical protein RRG08_025023 [Elysia crispata]|uniref:Uncharacterized protein n=1 Tax=Elysia crispata TaxID=231223 RepID=A0AAE1ANW2_9GAST|nr:hypothetical protein RRG08_025023 [Elysia crispata]
MKCLYKKSISFNFQSIQWSKNHRVGPAQVPFIGRGLEINISLLQEQSDPICVIPDLSTLSVRGRRLQTG